MQRHVSVDFALIEDGDHMYNKHLVDLYKVTGNYVLDALSRKAAELKNRRNHPQPEEDENDPALLEDNSDFDDSVDSADSDDFDDEF
jgi:predicted phosphoribosyltransferase